MNTMKYADKPYDPVLDYETTPVIKAVYAAILLYTGAKHVSDEPLPGVGLKFISDKHCEKNGIQKALEFEVRGTAGGFDPFSVAGILDCSPWIHTLARKDWLDADLYVSCSFKFPMFAVCPMSVIKNYQITQIEACNSDQPLFKRYIHSYQWDVYTHCKIFEDHVMLPVQTNYRGTPYLHSLWDSSRK